MNLKKIVLALVLATTPLAYADLLPEPGLYVIQLQNENLDIVYDLIDTQESLIQTTKDEMVNTTTYQKVMNPSPIGKFGKTALICERQEKRSFGKPQNSYHCKMVKAIGVELPSTPEIIKLTPQNK